MNNNKTALIVVAAVILLGGLWFMATRDDASMTAENNNTPGNTSAQNQGSSTAPTTAGTPQAGSVMLAETTPGSKVVVQSAYLTAPGYIVVYRSTTDGDTKIVGKSSLLEMGAYSNHTITLDSSVSKDQSVTAVLHKDDGDGKFEVPGDDSFMQSGSVRVISDVDVVGSPMSEEPDDLESQVEAYIEESEEASTTSN